MARQDIENLESGLVVRQKINQMFIELYALIGSGGGGTAVSNNVVTFYTYICGNILNIYISGNIGIEIGDTIKIYSGIDEANLLMTTTVTEIDYDRVEIDISSLNIEYYQQCRLKVYRANVLFGISEIYKK